MEDLKLKPYDRLMSILSESNDGQLTKNASDKIDFLLEEKPTFLERVKSFFSKIDGFIFKERSRTNNSIYQRRK
jgi:hypothetical protein